MKLTDCDRESTLSHDWQVVMHGEHGEQGAANHRSFRAGQIFVRNNLI